ncbi:GNAT family N-acetyltransferase [Kitasatospora sp. NPDC004531]
MPDEITLRPLTAEDVDLFERELAGPEGVGPYQWFGYRSADGIRRRFAENGLLGADSGVLAVAEAGRTVGRVEWFAASWGRPETSACWSLGIGLLPSAQGRGIGTRAQQLLADYLFAHTRAERLQAWTDFANLAEQRALEKAGFTREGVLRSAQWRGGRWHDQVIYSLLRTDAT